MNIETKTLPDHLKKQFDSQEHPMVRFERGEFFHPLTPVVVYFTADENGWTRSPSYTTLGNVGPSKPNVKGGGQCIRDMKGLKNYYSHFCFLDAKGNVIPNPEPEFMEPVKQEIGDNSLRDALRAKGLSDKKIEEILNPKKKENKA